MELAEPNLIDEVGPYAAEAIQRKLHENAMEVWKFYLFDQEFVKLLEAQDPNTVTTSSSLTGGVNVRAETNKSHNIVRALATERPARLLA